HFKIGAETKMIDLVTLADHKGRLAGFEITKRRAGGIVTFDHTVIQVLHTEREHPDLVKRMGIRKRSLPDIGNIKEVGSRRKSRKGVGHERRVRIKEVYIAIGQRCIHTTQSRQARVVRNVQELKRFLPPGLGVSSNGQQQQQEEDEWLQHEK